MTTESNSENALVEENKGLDYTARWEKGIFYRHEDVVILHKDTAHIVDAHIGQHI